MAVREIMQKAREMRIVIPAFNAAYLPMIQPIIAAVRKMNSFALIEVSRPDVERFGAQSYSAVAEEFQRHADGRHTALHLDHIPAIDEDGQSVDWKNLILEGISLGYESVMIDGSRLELEENISVTRRVVSMSHEKGVVVEAELGAVLGHEKGPLPDYESLFRSGRGFTEPSHAHRFVSETGVDWLSVAIGNIHGALTGAGRDTKKVQARLDILHLEKLSLATGVPLVLHGGSGIQQSYVLEAIQNGICKINVGTEIRQVYEKARKEKPQDTSFAQEQLEACVVGLIRDYYHVDNSRDKLQPEVLHA